MGVPTTGQTSQACSAQIPTSAPHSRRRCTPDYFAIGELGGAYSTNDTEPETETASIHMGVDLTKITPKDLILGLVQRNLNGLGLHQHDVRRQGQRDGYPQQDIHEPSAATTYFTNDALDLGPLSGYGSTLKLDISLSITEAQIGGFDFGMLVGDPPPASNSFSLAKDLLGAPESGMYSPLAQAAIDNQHYLLASNPV